MNTYVVAYWNDHTGELLQEIVEANSKVEAVKSYMQWDDEYIQDMDTAVNYAANCDSMVSVIEIKPTFTKRFSPDTGNLFHPSMIQ